MPRAYSQDLRWRVIFLTEIIGLDVEEAAFTLQISTRTISRYVSKFRTLGNLNTKTIGRTVGCISVHPHEEFVILERILQNPESTIPEIIEEIHQETGSLYACSTMHYYLKRNGFTQKKLVKIARQRSEEARIEFRAVTCLFRAEMFVYLDESGFDKRIRRSYGYSLKGKRGTLRRIYSPWGPRITAIPVILIEGLLNIGICNGLVNGETFLEFVHTTLAPCLLPFDGFNLRSTVILDNAAIHHTREVIDAINSTEVLLIFLPPYSPDMMPCEELFSKTKHYIVENDLAWQACNEPELMVLDSFLQVTDQEIRNYIEHVEYY